MVSLVAMLQTKAFSAMDTCDRLQNGYGGGTEDAFGVIIWIGLSCFQFVLFQLDVGSAFVQNSSSMFFAKK